MLESIRPPYGHIGMGSAKNRLQILQGALTRKYYVVVDKQHGFSMRVVMSRRCYDDMLQVSLLLKRLALTFLSADQSYSN
jgi:hypothetical protein